MKNKFNEKVMQAVLLLLTIGLISAGYFGYQYYRLWRDNLFLEKEFGQIKSDLALTRQHLDSTLKKLASTSAERDQLRQDVSKQQIRLDSLASQVENITGAVGTLEKLKKIDPQLLQKYSKVYFLNENYVPSSLAKIDPRFAYTPQKDLFIHGGVAPFLNDLLFNASGSGIGLKIVSGYRSFGEQAGIKTFYNFTYGAGTSNRFVADQGYSEHQLGTTVDFTDEKGPLFTDFEKRPAYAWLQQNAYRYGFILSYPQNNGYFHFEPWHWRFVGVTLANKLHNEGKNFYDLDQREINKYLISFFD
jgi:LAS superfamily LD-carboxypeptidase LdcB